MEQGKNVMQYVNESINQEYVNWGAGDVIKITAPTGRGKSTFVLYELLPYIIGNSGWVPQKILYLVNRKILQSQIEEELRKKVEPYIYQRFGGIINIQDYIQVTTYQRLENSIKNNVRDTIMWLDHFSHVVCDECHYFYADSNFNTNTELAYDCLRRAFANKIQIFISATIENMSRFIEGRDACYLDSGKEKTYQQQLRDKRIYIGISKEKIHEYSLEKDYSYLNIHTFDFVSELIHIIRKSNTKWLVFTDSIEGGKKFVESLQENVEGLDAIDEDEIAFIDADYESDDIATREVKKIVEQKSTGKKVIVSTAVMDNGISFIDAGLRNLVIMADTKESFIQMLGRKREDGEKVELYICKRDKQHFMRRKVFVDKIIGYYNKYVHTLKDTYNYNVNGNVTSITPFIKHFYLNGLGNEAVQHIFWPQTNLLMDLNRQQRLLDEMLGNQENYKCASKICYAIDGLLATNKFAISRVKDLQVFYQKMIDRLEEDTMAFVKEQLNWIEQSEEELIKVEESDEERYKELIIKVLDSIVGKELTTQELTDAREPLLFRKAMGYFYEKAKPGDGSGYRKVFRSKATFEEEGFSIVMEAAKLPYTFRKEGKSTFIIEKDFEFKN